MACNKKSNFLIHHLIGIDDKTSEIDDDETTILVKTTTTSSSHNHNNNDDDDAIFNMKVKSELDTDSTTEELNSNFSYPILSPQSSSIQNFETEECSKSKPNNWNNNTEPADVLSYFPFHSTVDISLAGIECKLVTRDLWCNFNKLGTEMIITKSGRRMFPNMKICFIAHLPLHPMYSYLVAIDVVPVDNRRYRYAYHRSSWQVAGRADALTPQGLYIHPDSPFTAEQLLRQTITFEKLKLTNNTGDRNGHIILNSMHKYQPRIHLLKVTMDHCLQKSKDHPDQKYVRQETFWKASRCFVFPETSFIAVTAYQNQLITKLKIDTNPFAKGFRDSTRLPEVSCGSSSERSLQQSTCRGKEGVHLNLAHNFIMFGHALYNQLKNATPNVWQFDSTSSHHERLAILHNINHQQSYYERHDQFISGRKRKN